MKKQHQLIICILLSAVSILTINFGAANSTVAAQKSNRQFNSTQQKNFCIVKKGDHLWGISRRHNVKFRQLVKKNDHFENKDKIYPGNRVYLPPQAETDTPPAREEKTPPPEPVNKETNGNQETEKINNIAAKERKVVDLVNQERQKIGLEPYQHNQKLSQVARTKSEDMRENNYFSHQSPQYGSPFAMMKQFDIDYQTAGENIAKGQRTPQEVVTSWMNSSGHRRNILSQEFTEIGVGLAKNKQGETFWTQMFIRP